MNLPITNKNIFTSQDNENNRCIYMICNKCNNIILWRNNNMCKECDNDRINIRNEEILAI